MRTITDNCLLIKTLFYNIQEPRIMPLW